MTTQNQMEQGGNQQEVASSPPSGGAGAFGPGPAKEALAASRLRPACPGATPLLVGDFVPLHPLNQWVSVVVVGGRM